MSAHEPPPLRLDCQADGCTATAFYSPPGARTQAFIAGWRENERGALCPSCATAAAKLRRREVLRKQIHRETT